MAIWSPSSSINLLLWVVLVFSTLHKSSALFSKTTRWGDVSVQRNSNGTWCYLPTANAVRDVTCKGTASNFASVMNVHLNQGLSIAYYNGIDNVLLGGASYSLPVGANMPIIRLCVSGRAGDGYYYETICLNAVADDVLSNTPYCQVALGQKEVTDGCYEPNLFRPASSVSGSRVLSTATAIPTFGTTYTSKSRNPEKFSITSCGVLVAVIVVRTLLLL